MPISYRERIGQMFGRLWSPLDAFISASVAAELSGAALRTVLVAARGIMKGIEGKSHNSSDIQVQLRMFTEGIVVTKTGSGGVAARVRG